MNNFWSGVFFSVCAIALGEFIFILWCGHKNKKELEDQISDEAFRKVQGKSDEDLKKSLLNHLNDDS